MPDPRTASAWYDLVLRILFDLRGAAFRQQRARRANYRDLFDQLRAIHADYLGMFARFKYSLARKDPSIIEASKAEFLENRERGGKERIIALMDAEVLACSNLPDQEAAFLRSVHGYLIVRDSPFGDLGSLSGLFWLQIQHETDADALLRDCEKALTSISKAYRRLVASYAELEPTFRLSKNTNTNDEAP